MSSTKKKPFTPMDFLKFEFVGDPQVSPDGKRVAFVRTVTDPKTNRYRSVIMTMPFDGSPGDAVPFTSGVNPDSHPRWSPDGRWLAFLSGRDPGVGDEEAKKKAGAQIWVAPTSGGEARPITAIKGGATGFVWSPDSSFIAFTAAIKPEGPEWLTGEDEKDKKDADGMGDKGEETAGAEAEADSAAKDRKPGDLDALYKKHNEDVKHITRIFYRLDGAGYLENKRSQVFVVDVKAALAGDPEQGPAVRPVQVTSGEHDHHGPAFSPDGRFIAVSAYRVPEPDLEEISDIWVFPTPGRAAAKRQAEPHRLTDSTGPFHNPAWSPCGRYIAFVGHTLEYDWYSDDKVWLVEVGPDGAARGKAKCLTPKFGRSFGDQSITDMRVGGDGGRPHWSPDGKTLFLLASDHGTTHLHAVDVATGRVAQLTTEDRVLFGWSCDDTGTAFAFAVATAEKPNDIYVGRLPADVPAERWPAAPGSFTAPEVIALRPVTATNLDLLAEHHVCLPERYTFSAPGGPTVDGWAMKPVGFEPGKKYPTLLQIHGGPMAMYTGTFFFEFQLIAAAGIGIIWTNPRGSQGYGEEFCAGIREEWGVNDYADIMAGVDAALARFDWIDGDRLGVAGGSYGGYMTSWIIGHTDRFKAACSMRAVNNCHSFMGTSDTGFHWDRTWHGTPWDKWENLIRQSPITYVGNVKTPTLVIHSEEDYRCLIEQGEQMFMALKKLGVETEFLRYPGESHGLSRGGKPWHRIHRLKSIVDWFAKRL